MDQLFVPVRAGRSSRDEPVPDVIEQRQELLVGLRTEAAQHRCLVQARGGEEVGIELAVSHALVIGQVDAIESRIHLGACAHEARLQAQLAGVAAELLPHAQRHHNASRAAGMRTRQSHDLQLLHALAEAEPLE
ncbi:hypothetical protein AB8813_08860 [Xanthomonas arboricola pv. corylina]|uniref:hypothetical protein n=1 Tax=Xanthomonas arboricola TaxID=56448 RepID=UPI001CA577D7